MTLKPKIKVFTQENTVEAALKDLTKGLYDFKMPRMSWDSVNPYAGLDRGVIHRHDERTEAIKCIEDMKSAMWPDQRQYYNAIYAMVFNYGGTLRSSDPWANISTLQGTGTHLAALQEAWDWLNDGDRRTGRSTALAIAFIEKAVMREGAITEYYDHPTSYTRSGPYRYQPGRHDHLDRYIKANVRRYEHLQRRFIFERYAIIFNTLGYEAIPFPR